MHLDRIHIKNFRSIKDETIRFDHSCKILVGKNEAGKSNALKAIAAIFGQFKIQKKDKRKRINNEIIEEYFVRAILTISAEDHDSILNKLKNKFKKIELIKLSNQKTLSQFIKENFKEFIMQIDVEDDSVQEHSYWDIKENKGELKDKIYIKGGELTQENGEEFDLVLEIFNILREIYLENKLECHYWKYSEKHLLPGSVSISEFKANPSNFKALENIFVLCNRSDINQEFSNAMDEDGDYSNLLSQVSEETTRVFKNIWKDFKNTSIELIPNGEEILIKVVNKTKYSFEDRSDGFKRFISILLMLSTQSRSNLLGKNDIILIDEPDQSLYPTSAQYLKDELLKIAQNSFVVYSTHSQYMIDSNCIDRHLIVEKNNDITTIGKQSENAPFSNDELLKRAVGSSIFECIQPINIIFEGWLDKELFDKYCKFHKIKTFDSVGKVYLRGISGIELLVQILILANKKFIIVADSDKVSNDKKKTFGADYFEFKDSWISYSDINSSVATMEDFLKPEFIESVITTYGIKGFAYDLEKGVIQNIQTAVLKDKSKVQEVKKLLIKNLNKKAMQGFYGDYIDRLKLELSKLQS